jgi:beta-glucoside operon transcriptional antiterminator
MNINRMQIDRILNNNVVITLGENQQETVVMGKGIGFQKKPGESINPQLIEKIFSLNNPYSDHFKALLEQVPASCISATEEIIALAKTRLATKLHASVLISLVDHLHYALQRFAENITIPNALLWAIKKLYASEFAIGKESLQIIYRHTGVLLPEDEAGYIALHLVNAQLNDNMQNTMKITRFMQDILSLVQYHFALEYNEDSLSYQRFITHLKFFAQRIFDRKFVNNDDPSLPRLVREKYVASHECAEKINKYIALHHDHALTEDELMFLTIHIEQLRK